MKISRLILLVSTVLALTSCQKALDYFDKDETESVSQISVYPIFDLIGGNRIAVKAGAPFTDPGCSASEVKKGDSDLQVSIKGNIDTQVPGVYFLTYIAKNKYGYVDSVKRTILVYEGDLSLNPNISGKYKLGTSEMVVAKSDVDGFWAVGNMNSAAFAIAGEIADIGNGQYVIVPGVAINPQTGLAVNYSGTAVLQANGDLWFYISTSTSPRKWKKV